MKIQQALEILDLHAQDYAAPKDLREAVDKVKMYFDIHPVVYADAFFAALAQSSARAKDTRTPNT